MVTPSCKMAVDVNSCVSCRWTKALVGCLLLLMTSHAGSQSSGDMNTGQSLEVNNRNSSKSVIDATPISLGESTVKLSAETILQQSQTTNQSLDLDNAFTKTDIIHSSSVPINFSEKAQEDESTEELSTAQRLARSIDSKLTTSKTLDSNSEPSLNKKESSLESSDKSRNQIDTNEVDNVGMKAGEYYRQIQPTKTISLHQLVDAKIVKTTAVDGKVFKEYKNSGEGYGAPRGRSLPLTEPDTPMSSVGGMVTSNVSETMQERSTMKEVETPRLPAASFRSSYDDRKTNSDIQDIITGIVKLLNGNVKVQANPNLPPGGLMGAGRPLRPLSTRINNRGPPRITDVPPLPLDFDTPGPVPHRSPPLPPLQTSSRVPPPYPFDRPPAIVPLPPQPTELNHPGDHPFMSGVPLPEQVVPVPNTKRPPQDNLGIVRPHRPRPHRPRLPPMGNKTRRPPPMPTIDLTQPFPQFRPDMNKKPHPEVSISLMDDHYEDSQEQPHTTTSSQVPVTILEEESGGAEEEVKVEEDIATISTPSSLSTEAPSVFSEEDTSYVTTEDNKDELPSKAVAVIEETSDKVLSSQETSSSSEGPKIIVTLTSSSSTVNEATQEVKPLKDDLPSSSELSILLEPSIGVGVATPVLESSMQEILTHDTTSSSDSGSHQATPTNALTTLSPSSSIVRVTTSDKETPSISTSSSKSPEKQQQSGIEQEGGQGFPYYPYRPRPGIVLDDTEYKPGGVKNRPIITAPTPGGVGGRPGDIFDVTVTAIQGPGGGSTGQPFVYPVEMEGVQLPGAAGSEVPVITKAEEGQHFVSIDGKRTYINLFGSSNEQGNVAPTRVQQSGHTHPPKQAASTIGTGFAVPETDENVPRPGMGHSPPAPPHRPYNRRPNHPPVRIDTCIVGDDSTCDSAQNEMCRTEVGVSSCHCRPGYSRRKHREPCRRVVSILMSLRVDRLYDKRVVWDGKLQDPESEEYKTLEWESSRAIDSAMSMTPFSDDFMGVRVNGLYTLPGGSEPGGAKRGAVFVNLTLQLEESVETLRPAVRHDIQRHLLGVIHRRNNNVGHSALWVDSPPGSVSHLQDVDECSSRDLHDCHLQARCSNIFGSFRCSCPEGYRDPWAGNPHRSGRQCETCPPEHCSSHGECRYEGGQPVCYCSSNFYGSQCEVDGEVLGVAIGASVAAVIIIVLTLVCLCMWSRRWSREQKTAAGMGSPVFGYMATGGSTVKTPAIGSPPYQVSLEDRLRWAQIADVMVQANHYAQPEPVPGPTRPSSAMFGYPSLTMSGTQSHAGAPPVPLPRLGLPNMSHTGAMSIHGGPALSIHGAFSTHGGLSSHGMRTPDRTVESTSSEEEDRADLLGRNFHVPRPKSRSSVTNQSGIYYDVDYEQENIYGTSKNQPVAIPLSTYTMSSRPPYFRQ